MGATFDVYLQTHGLEPVREINASPPSGPHTGTVLVVDDDEYVRRVLVEALSQAGFKVLQAADGSAGLAAFDDAADSIDLVVTDTVMPRLGGSAMVECMENRLSATRYLVCSSYAAEAFGSEFFHDARHAYLPKPFRPVEFVEAVARLLEVPTERSGLSHAHSDHS